MVVVLNGVLVLLLVTGIRGLANIDPSGGQPSDRAASVPQSTPSGGSISDRLGSLDQQLGAVSR
jgi:hypothetical protein